MSCSISAVAENWNAWADKYSIGLRLLRKASKGRGLNCGTLPTRDLKSPWMLNRELGHNEENGRPPTALPESWIVEHGPIKFEAKLTDFGHVGLFPEQAENWDWLAEQVRVAKQQTDAPLRVLNLFAYTGGSTLAAAAAGAEVTHVDAAKNIVAWGRRNAELSGLSERAHPLDCRRCVEVRPPRSKAWSTIRCRDFRPAELWSWLWRRAMETGRRFAGAIGGVP